MHALDRPVWNALSTGWASLAEGGQDALRLDPRYGPFAATVDDSVRSATALAGLLPEQGELWLVTDSPLPAPPNAALVRTAALAQMVADRLTPSAAGAVDHIVLTEADAPEMHALATLTRPGPFYALTHRLGRFIGVRREGRLVAMAGERMRLPGFAEVSGVCTHPDHRGRGYAGRLMRIVAGAMLDRGETPFLHAYASNHAAIALYETLGFMVRREMTMAVLKRPDKGG
ncbi:GNAT family N-acetyltransferase [Sphingobium sp. AN558]|uniref:GNAT family N-acetyltransferase n=1 Tax=Sphingobium sp. AN558 TaxID=3133442 RepID=UPI0030BB0CA0